jgi:hypothetical protein
MIFDDNEFVDSKTVLISLAEAQSNPYPASESHCNNLGSGLHFIA